MRRPNALKCSVAASGWHFCKTKLPQRSLAFRVFLNLWFGEPVVCTLDSRGFRRFHGFRDFRESSTLFVVVSVVFVVFVIFVISVVFVKGDPHPNHRFGKP